MKFTAVGDIIIGRRIPADFAGYQELKFLIEQGDARFFNLETTLHKEGECFASETSGGTLKRLTIYPILLPMTGKKSEIGLPRLAKDASFLEGFFRRCEAYGTKFQQNPDGSFSWIA